MSERSGAAGENNGKIASARRKGPTGARGAREANAKRPGKNLSVEVNRAHGTRRGRGLLGGLGGHRLHHLPRTLVLTVDESYPRLLCLPLTCRPHVRLLPVSTGRPFYLSAEQHELNFARAIFR